MPIVGADAPKIWAEPNTLDDLPVEAITQANQSLKGIAPIDKNLKATDFPEYIMPEKQGSDKLTAHRVWAPPPAGLCVRELLFFQRVPSLRLCLFPESMITLWWLCMDG